MNMWQDDASPPPSTAKKGWGLQNLWDEEEVDGSGALRFLFFSFLFLIFSLRRQAGTGA